MITAPPSAQRVGNDRLVSATCDPVEFVRETVAWDRARLAEEVQRELRAASLVWDRSLVERTRPPRGCRRYVNFLTRLEDWLTTGAIPRYARRDTRELLLALGEALVKRGQMDREQLAELQPRPLRLR
jgi:hypothetical protein